jgi:hypothetical protein
MMLSCGRAQPQYSTEKFVLLYREYELDNDTGGFVVQPP